MTAKTLNRIVQARTYRAMVQEFPPRPIHSSSQCSAVCKVIERLMAVESPSADQLDFIELLSGLVVSYETAMAPMPAVTLAELLAHLIEAKGVTRAEVAKSASVSPTTISDVLAGRRSLSRGNIKRLSDYFHVNPSLFLDAIAPGTQAA